jgi:hypothetical protein
LRRLLTPVDLETSWVAGISGRLSRAGDQDDGDKRCGTRAAPEMSWVMRLITAAPFECDPLHAHCDIGVGSGHRWRTGGLKVGFLVSLGLPAPTCQRLRGATATSETLTSCYSQAVPVLTVGSPTSSEAGASVNHLLLGARPGQCPHGQLVVALHRMGLLADQGPDPAA